VTAYQVDQGIALLEKQDFHVVITDFRMPGRDGLSLIEECKRRFPKLPVVMISAFGDRDLSSKAIAAGARDVISKPVEENDIRQILTRFRPRSEVAVGVDLILIGASTGGPEALTKLLRDLPNDLPPIIIVQHIKSGFEAPMIEQIHHSSKLLMGQVEDNQILESGRFYLARGGTQLGIRKVAQQWRLHVDRQSGPMSGHRPSVDYLFQSVARVKNPAVLACLLTGMGRDGADGLLALRQAGAFTMAQDEASSVVYGMPRAAIDQGAAIIVGDLEGLRAQILQRCRHPALPKKIAI
jgi:two-component system chemotaxis response regulator CheB